MSRAHAQTIIDDTATYLRGVPRHQQLEALATAAISLRFALDLCPDPQRGESSEPSAPVPGPVPAAAPAAAPAAPVPLRGRGRITTACIDGIIYYEGRRFCSPFRPCTTVEVFPGPGRCVTAKYGNIRHVCEPKRPEPSCTIRPPSQQPEA